MEFGRKNYGVRTFGTERCSLRIYQHSWRLDLPKGRLSISMWKYNRARRFHTEVYKQQGSKYRFYSIGIADPKVHRRWARTLTVYLNESTAQ